MKIRSERGSGGASGWEAGWDAHRRAQLLRMARLTLEEKLQWLEDAQRLVTHLEGDESTGGTGGPASRGQSDC